VRMKLSTRGNGYSLVELLVVIAIIVTMAAAAVPSFVKYARLASSEPDYVRRELFAALRAAKVYALTFRTDTAIAYAVNIKNDSVDGIPTQVFDGFIMCRRANDIETNLFGLAKIGPATASTTGLGTFVPVRDESGRMSSIRDGICVFPDYRGSTDREIATVASDLGVMPIYVVDMEASVQSGTTVYVTPRVINGQSLEYGVAGFPAHVFQASGILRSTSPKTRVTLDVAPAPDRAVDDRYVEVPDGVQDDATGRDGLRISKQIEVFTTLGRIKLSGAKGTS
jgi:prepilin-type N-terminal cleavage/methylation domain-containing protein